MIGVLAALAITFSALYASAQSAHKVSNVPYSLLATGNYDNTVVNDAGNTGEQIVNLIVEWCKINGHAMSDTGNKTFILTEPHENTAANKRMLYPFYDRTPSGPAMGWEYPLFKEECCNLVADSRNETKLVELLKKFNSGNFISTTWGNTGGTPKGDGSSSLNNNQNLNNKIHMDTIQVLISGSAAVNAGATNGSAGLPWWAILLIILGSLALIALLIYFLRPRPARDFIAQLEDSWDVEDNVLRHNRRRIRRADDFQSERNDFLYEENQRLNRLYTTPPNHGGGH
ncbi:hypothetical protein A3C57_01885 [Candidatus Nomurabacteria bacterium RIFCSPHIGHO2_02_FULL_33_12]|uniref:Uncharacterized protein n=1 Tax=Candidatus Nomurabacteria bacterium RIFCSPLOWO2_01_FULL_33_17 TaxID=1801764 RepID=A0A1F6WN13_9BACT|nr:MAG: hypothetical protein A3C57_01885 [Candidatus Nomurabacteria bacterium RIFCSPHIGHO2_02_FULL_33_12]OGI83263.1 MAG: hypothetical protein A2903_02715 [Candidatus Nomurabacteria bacterium RIFCSPLOWO2_01_FULL_33_17]